MGNKYIFISYKRADPTTMVAQQLFKRIVVNLKGHGFEDPFFDRKSIDAGDSWEPMIDQALDRTTHFIALLSDDYWLSEQCQRELVGAVTRWEQHGVPKLLFVLTERMDPSALVIERGQGGAAVQKKFPQVERLSQINFLGPYDAAGRLIRLNCTDHNILGDQLFSLIQDIRKIT
ncbi:toll/interleukin-1 receptor domain-containing protein [Azotobacter beijerinckii]|uniref:TIR domain-containing protein n=1 Tax=Azotobacter beijerinckii TaxID=170623 RepID=A0A1I1CLI2_9GAMM|nr:toll/interleukin-1 receptor domain-containing protein [Azotobacter beijerinckii]SFB63531.1 TIR domain-containing protein [Azotobacter beijerinckii]